MIKYTNSADGVRIAYTSRGEGEPALAFIHGGLADRTFWASPAFDFAVSEANNLHTDSARTFLTNVAQSHPNAEMRAHAATMLADWAGTAEETQK